MVDVLGAYRREEIPTDRDICAMVLMLYPAKGESKLRKPDKAKSFIYSTLNDAGMKLYKNIFDNNNKENIKDFF